MNLAANSSKTLVVVMGGTIDAFYNPEHGTPHTVPVPDGPEKSCIPDALKKLGIADACEVWTYCMKDSKKITKADLDGIVKRVENEGYNKVVVVHGTDTMPNSGLYLQDALKDTDARVVITGSMYPLRDAQGQWRGLDAQAEPVLTNVIPRDVDGQIDYARACDGWVNLKQAISDVQNPDLKAGVYIRVRPESVELGDGPWHASMLSKYVITDAPGTQVGTVQRSGFVVRSAPATAQEISFNF
ncbi:MAG: asparaginase [Alphaproteobacteria bacterium]|nr:asparaginase [Alphaproteobacteria bacterium]